MTERQREFVPGRGTKDGDRARANGRKLDRGILRLKASDPTWSGGCMTVSKGGQCHINTHVCLETMKMLYCME